MTNIILSGCGGRMGQVIAQLVAEKYNKDAVHNQESKICKIAFGVDPFGKSNDAFPVYPSFDQIPADAPKGDVIIDFSHFSAVRSVVDYAVKTGTPAIIATTGISQKDLAYINEQSAKVALFRSANMSVGICLVKDLIRRAAAFLGDDFDIEIVERHHNQKLDAPSGTALALADAINQADANKYSYIYDRHSRSAKRGHNEIGISAVRGGNIVGDHEVIFAGNNEVIEINHKAMSRSVFADGAVRAAMFMKGKQPGMYNMDDLIG